MLVVAVAAAWPLSAYAVDPFVLPVALALVASAAVVLVRPDMGVALVLVLSPQFNLALGPTSVKFLLYALAFGLLAFGVLVARPAGQAAPRSLTIGVGVFLGAAVLSAAAGIDPAGSVGRVGLLAAATALYFAVLTVCRTRRELLVVTAGALGGLLVAGAHGVVQHLTGSSTQYSVIAGGRVVERVQGSFGHPNELGGFLAVLMALATIVLVSRRLTVPYRLLAGAALAVSVPALFLTYSRGPIAALAAGLLLWTAVMRPRLAVPVAALLAAGALLLLPAELEERFAETSAGSVAIRSDIWTAALTIYSERPVLGVGLNNFPAAYAALPTELPGGVQRRLLHTADVLVPPYAENVYLNVLAEQGIVGIAALLILLGVAALTAYRGTRVRDPLGRAVCLGIGAALATLVLHGVVQVTLFTETVLPLFALLAVAGRFVTLDWADEDARAEAPQR